MSSVLAVWRKKKQCTWGKLNLKYWMILKLTREIVLFVDATVLMREYYGRNIWQVKCSVNWYLCQPWDISVVMVIEKKGIFLFQVACHHHRSEHRLIEHPPPPQYWHRDVCVWVGRGMVIIWNWSHELSFKQTNLTKYNGYYLFLLTSN